jgi:thiosulfate dehydrogenase [quinone] large subunit
VALVIGILVRTASVWGLIFMLALLFSSNYPGADAPLWQYFGAALNHLVLAMCFAAFVFGEADQAASLRAHLRRLKNPAK